MTWPAQAKPPGEILQRAIDSGVRTIDTARAYGYSEKIIGTFIEKTGRSDIEIVTKQRIKA